MTTPEYPLASRFVPAKFYKIGHANRPVNRIVIHITAGGSNIQGTIGWFQNPVEKDGTIRYVSAHYVVGQNGEVVQMVKDNDISYHAHTANGDSIGIEHCARPAGTFGKKDTGLMPTALQYEASAALVRWLCEQYDLPLDRDHIQGHAEADPTTTHKGCPDSVWDWEYYMTLVRRGACVAAAPSP